MRARSSAVGRVQLKHYDKRIKEIQKAFEARVARSLLRGLYLRFGADPTVGGMAMIAFRDGVTAVFPAADATAILA